MWISPTVLILAAFAVAFAIRARRRKAGEARLQALVDARTAELRELTEQLKVANAALEELASADAITGLANRRRFDVFIRQEWQRSSRSHLPLSLLLIDIDHFKKFNDRYGHPAGDDCIRRVADVLRHTANRVTDLCCRYGGEEFAVVLVDTDAAGALAVAERIRENVERLRIPHADSASGTVTVSVGVATRTTNEFASVNELISACDDALYRVKEDGRNDAQSAATAV
jgi:diguanylate cyclase (GGDEF)-like protein